MMDPALRRILGFQLEILENLYENMLRDYYPYWGA